MITKKLMTRLSIGLILGVAALTTSGLASAHDNGNHRGWRDDHHRHGHWHNDRYNPHEVVRIYERDRYYAPRYNYYVDNRPYRNDGLTIIYRDSWR